MLSRVLTPRSVLLKCHQPGLTDPSELEHSARKALEAYRSGPDHEPAVADVLEQFIGNPASRELDFRECAPDCLQIPDELVQALMALRFATPPRPGEACKLLFPAELKAYPMWMAHVPGWLASMNLREANAPFDAVESHDDLFSFEKDDLGYDRALTTRRGRDLIRRFYEVKDGADLRVPEIEGKPLSLCQFMSSLGGFLIELRNDAQACRRVAFECGAAGTHSTPVIYIKEGDRELMVCIDSMGMLETELQAISSASHQWNVVMLVVEKLGMAATRGCRAQCLEAGRRLVAMDDRGLPVIPVDDLLGRKLRRECDGEVFSIQLPDALLFYTDVSAFRESHRQPQGTVMRRRGNGKPQTLDEFVTANRTSSNGRVEYLRRKGLRYPVFIAIMAHLRRLIAASPIGWPVEMERAFIVQAQQHLLASKERCGAEGMDDRTGVELDLAALDDMLSGYGAAAPWSITMFKDRDESGTSLLEHVLESRNKARQRRVVSQALAFFESLAPKERGILLRLAMACEDPATLRLLLTVLNPEMEEVKQLLQSGASLDARQSDKMTLLGRAASHGDLVAVRQLLAIGCCVDQKAARGRTPLMQAVLEGHLPIVKELLAQRAQTDIRDKAGYPALAFASEQDDLEIVQALIDAGASPDHAAAHGETPLMVAAAAGQIGVANLLISRKANVLARDSQKKTALMHAASAGHLKVVELLADRATVNELDAFGMGALSCAVAADDIDMCRLLVRTGAQPSPVDGVPALITAVAAKKRAAMLWLLELPASDVNARRSGAGDTALTVAAREGTADLVDLLLEQPAIDVNATGHYGRTALWEAVAGGYEDLVMRLLAVGADAGIADAQGMTPMTLASRRGNSRIVDALDLALQH